MRVSQYSIRRFRVALPMLLLAVSASGQQTPPTQAAPSKTAAVKLSLADALERARQNSVVYQGAVADAKIAHEDKKQAVASLLPSVNYNNSAIYTDGNGPGNQVKFIANNAVHEYISQGNVHETLGVSGIAEARRVAALS